MLNFKLKYRLSLCVFFIHIFVFLPSCIGISITIHKFEDTPIASSVETSTSYSINRNDSYRQARYLPYNINPYINQNGANDDISNQKLIRYQVYIPKRQHNDYSTEGKNLYTPFHESDALPGSFVPITRSPQKNLKLHYVTIQKKRPQEVESLPPPDYGEIYGKLWEMKTKHHQPSTFNIRRPPTNDFPYEFKLEPTKTIIQTYSPTNIDIPSGNQQQQQNKNFRPILRVPSYNRNEHLIIQNIQTKPLDYQSRKQQKQTIYRKPILIFPKQQTYYTANDEKPLIFQQNLKPIQNIKQYSSPIVEENYVAQKYVNRPDKEETQTESTNYQKFSPNYYQYESDYQIQTITPTTPLPVVDETVTDQIIIGQNRIIGEGSDSLSLLLKKLQDANTLPHSLTVNNIDNSIRTLVQILNALKKQRKLSKPIIVADENETFDDNTEEYTSKPIEHVDTQEGGTPGVPGVDYPALSTIPPTSFNCKTQRYKGFFGDPETNCQVWHYCDLNGGQASFLCPNGTIFSQVALTCDWWYNVKCSSTAQLYVLNERLYKYILPFAPKFPEDYTGPLVDKYLALKFMEMEEKMKKERKSKVETQEDNTEETTEAEDTTIEESTEKSI